MAFDHSADIALFEDETTSAAVAVPPLFVVHKGPHILLVRVAHTADVMLAGRCDVLVHCSAGAEQPLVPLAPFSVVYGCHAAVLEERRG